MQLKFRARLRVAVRRIRGRYYNRVLRSWLAKLEIPRVDLSSRTFVFNTVRANTWNFHLYSDFFIGHLIAKNGGKAYVLLDDGVLQLWDTVQLNRFKGSRLNVMRSASQRRALMRDLNRLLEVFATPNLHLLWYSRFLPNSINESLGEEDENYARASTIRYFEQGVLDLGDEEQRQYHQLSRENAKISKAVGRYVVDQLKPDVYATSHGIYSTWGPAYHFVKQAGIETRVYSRHPYKLGGLLIRKEAGTSFNRDELERFLDNGTFDEDQRRLAQEYINSRFAHEATDTKEYFTDALSKDLDVSAKYRSRDYELTFGLFPNIAWDAVGKQNHGVYDNVIDWIVDTVRTISKDSRFRLIIRYHPSEATRMRGSVPSHQIIKSVLPKIEDYPNVTLIHAGEPVNSYDLLRESVDIALIFTSTFGAEAQLLGVPVVAAASGRFSERIVCRVRSRADYHQVLKNPQAVVDDFKANQQRIVDDVLKYHYYISQELFFPVGIMGRSNTLRIAYTDELKSQAILDQRGMKKTLLRLDVET